MYSENLLFDSVSTSRSRGGRKNMKLVFLDTKTIGEDIDLSAYDALGEVVKYGFSTLEEIPERVKDADVLIVNKIAINEQTIGTAKNLKLVCVTATGTNNLDKEYLKKRGIAWRNVAGYSTESVTQHTFALLFYLLEKIRYYDDYVKDEKYINDTVFTHFAEHFNDFETLLTTSDIVSVHAPLNEYTKDLMDREAFAKMKKTAIFLNLGRGPIVVEQDLYEALETGEIAAAGLDVLCEEPMSETNPLAKIKDSKKLIITPHIAWASVEARNRLMQIIVEQIREFL